jgi:hypothetical protein
VHVCLSNGGVLHRSPTPSFYSHSSCCGYRGSACQFALILLPTHDIFTSIVMSPVHVYALQLPFSPCRYRSTLAMLQGTEFRGLFVVNESGCLGLTASALLHSI